MSAKKPAGMRLRRPGARVPTEEEVRALELDAERIASKAPGVRAAPEIPDGDSSDGVSIDAPPDSSRKVQITAYLPVDVRDALRRAAVALSGPPTHETVTSIVERAIRRELERLHEDHGEFPNTQAMPRPGRRAGR